MLAVIADDITGAAEIAGIAHRYGLSSQLVITNASTITIPDTDVLVIATDTRSLPAQQAYEQTSDITRQLCALLHSPGALGRDFIFHKTDSALRGNVQEEIQAIIDNSPYTNAIYMPANPSKGRIIKDGIYYIHNAAEHIDTPLSETDFRFDPEFPATTSSVKERFPHLTIPDATCQADVNAIVEKAIKNSIQGGMDRVLFAGAADLFTSLLIHIYPTSSSRHDSQGFSLGATKLIVRGSTQSKAINLDIPVEVMPLDVFYEESAPCTWAATILNRHQDSNIILTIGDKEVRQGKHAAVYLRQAMAEVTCAILAAHTPDELIVEGGATAFAILSQTPWQSFRITDEIAPGVVRMQPQTQHLIHITLKPGSYDWGKLFCNE